jgi:hypothetical protein
VAAAIAKHLHFEAISHWRWICKTAVTMSMTSAAFRLNSRALPFAVALHAGRLLEIRIEGQMRTRRDIQEFEEIFMAKIEEAKRNVVIIADYRQAIVFAPERAEEWGTLIRSASPFIDRSAILLDQQRATFNLQLQRSVLRAQNRNRKMFFHAEEARLFLSAVLTDLERARLGRLLAT